MKLACAFLLTTTIIPAVCLVAPGALGDVIFTNLVVFSGANGANPWGPLMQSNDGTLYGTTISGGASGSGTIFKVTTNGALTTLFSFNGADGASPYAGLVQGMDGRLYGTTKYGGTNHDIYNQTCGTAFRITANGVLEMLVEFNVANGDGPGGLTPGADGNFYGITELGGRYNQGTIFRMSTNGAISLLLSFDGTNGSLPQSPLVQGRDGILYGTAIYGGANGLPTGAGTVFGITTNGTFTFLISFAGTNGSVPAGGLVQGTDGSLYGTTGWGGATFSGPVLSGTGTVFRITTNGILTTLYSFTGGNDGRAPQARLIQAKDGYLYGTTAGAVFQMTTNGFIIPLAPAGSPFPGLIQGQDGCFYGMTSEDGVEGDGTIFRISPAPPVFKSWIQLGNTITFNWSSMAGQNYQMEYTANLNSSQWASLGGAITATNTSVTASAIASPDPETFYRVRLSSPP
jgi:uncharacterized repeat protein (TIGR03803 family)